MKFYSRFICEQCPASFIHKNHLNRHIKKAHTGDAAAKPQKKPRQPRSSNKGFTMSYMNFFIFILCNWDFCIEKTSYQKYYLKGVTQKTFWFKPHTVIVKSSRAFYPSYNSADFHCQFKIRSNLESNMKRSQTLLLPSPVGFKILSCTRYNIISKKMNLNISEFIFFILQLKAEIPNLVIKNRFTEIININFVRQKFFHKIPCFVWISMAVVLCSCQSDVFLNVLIFYSY